MGKLGPKELLTVIRCIEGGSSILVPPRLGFDSGVQKIKDDLCLVISTDPCVGVPKAWFGWLLIHYAASDVAVFGAKPEFCTVNLLGPPNTPTHVLETVMKSTCRATKALGMQVVTGHTGTYKGLSDLVGVCTAYGLAPCSNIITPAGARPGDRILCTKQIGLETIATVSQMRRSLANRLFGKSEAARFSRQFRFQSCVREALALSKFRGVHAMHDAAEGGLVSALNEMAEASKTGFYLDFEALPVTDEVDALVRHFRLSRDELMSMSSTGTLVAALDPHVERNVMRRLLELKISSCVVGTFSQDRKRTVKKDFRESAFPDRPQDPFGKICR
jgi:hydrogenase expression/formation protein HypE